MVIVKHIPNSITCLNLLSGCIGIVFCLKGRLDVAFVLMLAAAVFDFCDGFAARALGAYSDIGKELDSLADVVSFGVLPSIILFSLMEIFAGPRSLFSYLPFLLAAFSALRLAKFNLDERQHDSFLGLATPASAMICGSYGYLVQKYSSLALEHPVFHIVFILCLTAVLCSLMVSEIQMFNMKFNKLSEEALAAMSEDEKKALVMKENLKKQKRIAFITIVVIIVATVSCLGLNWSLVFFLTFMAYIIMNLIFRLFPSTR